MTELITLEKAEAAKELLWSRLLPNFPEIAGMRLSKHEDGWHIEGRLETQPFFEGKEIEMTHEFMGIPVHWQVVGRIVAAAPINVWYSDGVRYEDYRQADGRITTEVQPVSGDSLAITQCPACGHWGTDRDPHEPDCLNG